MLDNHGCGCMRTIILTFDEYLLISDDCIDKYCKILKVASTVLLSNDCSIANWGDSMSDSYWAMVSYLSNFLEDGGH